jgi:hypothetical protein
MSSSYSNIDYNFGGDPFRVGGGGGKKVVPSYLILKL